MPVRLVLVMVTSNSYDLGVTANTLQDINPWPGDQIRHITPRWRSRRFRNTGFPSSVLRSLALSRESARTYRQRGPLARPLLNQSTLLVRQQRHRVASPAGQSRSPVSAASYGAERNPVSFIDRICWATIARAAQAARSIGPASSQSISQIFSFDSSSIAWRRLQFRVSSAFSATSYGAERKPVIFIDSSC